MHSAVRSVALALAVFAMVLRGLLPDGWMPAPGAGTPVIVCPGQSDMQAMPMHGTPLQHGLPLHRSHICPFAALAQLATHAAAPLVALSVAQRVAHTPIPIAFVFTATSYRAQSPRGPPLSA
jgi:2-hydroxychromene-2-carboxylate isomerase